MPTHHSTADQLSSKRPETRRRLFARTAGRLSRGSAAALGTIGLIIASGLAAGALAAPDKPTKPMVIEHLTGARISLHGAAFESVYKVLSPTSGTGAAIQDGTFTTTTFPLTGKDTFTNYFADGTLKTANTFTLSSPDANGIGNLTGNGKCTGGTGAHKHERCAYTFSGTYDYNTTLTKFTSTGTDTR